MKHLIPLISFIFIFSTHSFGQFQKGTWTINANSTGFFTISEDYNSLSMSTEVGYFPVKWLLLGAELSYDRKKYRNQLTHDISPSPYVRFYLNPDGNTKLYGQIGSDINLFSVRYRSSESGSELSYSRKIFRPKFDIGFNHFITKNVAFEGGINMIPSETVKFKIGDAYDYEYYNYNYSTVKNGALIIPHFGIRLFLNTAHEDDGKSWTDYLQARNYTMGVSGNYMYQASTEYGLFNGSFNFQGFVAERLSMGASIQLVSDGNNSITGIAPTIEYYMPASNASQIVASASVSLFSEYLPTTYNVGLKVNTFIEDNISLWMGPFASNSGGIFSGGWRLYLGAGANYFITNQQTQKSSSKKLNRYKFR